MSNSASLMLGFESLGDNCEFGLVQRHYGVEPLGLMRWARCTLDTLLLALEERFAAMGDPARLVVHHFHAEYLVTDRSYNFSYHPHVKIADMSEAALIQREVTRIAFLRTKLLDDLATAEKIFVFKENTHLTSKSARRLFTKLREYGRNRLLYVVRAPNPQMIGTVVQLERGLVRGHVAGFGRYETLPDNVGFDTWWKLCEATDALLV